MLEETQLNDMRQATYVHYGS